MPKIEAFEQHTEDYAAWFRRNPAVYAAELETLRPLLPGGEGFEIGVGAGHFAVPLGIGVGVEPSPRMAERARASGVRVLQGVAEALPFSEERFDFALMVTTICFVDDVPASLAEAARVLRPGGALIVGFVDKLSELGQRYMERQGTSRFYQQATFFSTDEVRASLAEAGFLLTEARQTLLPGEARYEVRQGTGLGAFVGLKAVRARHDHKRP